ncbi:DUF4087 domain-containing protein [Phyllobacterium sp. K27]
MRLLLTTCFCLFVMSLTAAADAERRRGWYSSPTPGNLILTDREGNWWIQMQGGPDPKGIANAPVFDEREFVETGVPGSGHGYGCACMTAMTNPKEKRITRVIVGNTLPLARCHNDKYDQKRARQKFVLAAFTQRTIRDAGERQ